MLRDVVRAICSAKAGAASAGGAPENLRCGTASRSLRILVAILIPSLSGCALSDRVPDPPPPVYVSASTWWQVDRDINAASLAAVEEANLHAYDAVENWRARVHERTEADYIPWFSGYWTQQWLAIKVGWYKLGSEDGRNSAINRLSLYLQEQYHDRVLDPVAEEIDPSAVREQATARYVRVLGKQLREIPLRYGVPPDQFEKRLENIPAIALAPSATGDASLSQIVHADPLAGLPAYANLMAQIRKNADDAHSGLFDARIAPVARQTSERLVTRLATSGGASAAAAAVGGIAGVIISLGAAGIGVITHENERPEMEAQLREGLNGALHDMYLGLKHDPATGVMAGVLHISGQIEGTLAQTLVLPIRLEPLPGGAVLPEEQPVPDEFSEDEILPEEGVDE